MKEASRILILIGFVFAVLGVVFTLGFAIFSIVVASPSSTSIIIDGLKNGTIHTSFVGTVEQQAAAIQKIFVGLSTFMFISFAIEVGSSIFAFMANHRDSMAVTICALIFAILTGNIILIIGVIMLLVNQSQNNVETI